MHPAGRGRIHSLSLMLPKISCSDIEADRVLIDSYLDRMLRAQGSGTVVDAMRYAVLNGGQRLRPLLTLRVARMLGEERVGTMRVGAAVELVHCASLIIDDLPCMDNSPVRRGQPSTHVAFGEPVAILAGFALVALAARVVMEGDLDGSETLRLLRFQKRLLRTLDCSSLIAGQALDLQLTGEARLQELPAISELKTVPLFQLAFLAGSVFADMAAGTEAALEALGREFGMAYQMADDYLDGEDTDRGRLDTQFERTRVQMGSTPGKTELLEDVLEYIHGKTLEASCSHR
ncbi:MAG: polyprenyl synthetase family protein [Bryobacterales bacterium]|nr:polyprenyl synthetase family protein [Bryobacterales bacterium]